MGGLFFRRRVVLVSRLLMVLALLGASSAWASLPDVHGGSARSAGMVGTGVASANDGTAAYYNPAMLAFRRSAVLSIEVATGSSSADVRSLEVGRTVDDTYLQSPVYMGGGLGLVLPFGGKLRDYLTFGLDFYSPAEGLLRARSPDPSQPYLYMHHNTANRLIAAASLGIRVADTVAVGLGALVLADLDGSGATVTLDALNRSLSYRDIDSGLYTKFAPIIGLSYEATPGLMIGLSYRGEMDNLNHIPANIHLGELAVIGMDISMRNHYTPHTLSAGVSYAIDPGWTVVGEAIYGMWSRTPTPYTSIVVDVSGDLLDSIGLGSLLDMEARSLNPRFKDNLSLKLATEGQVSDWLTLRFGAGYRPSPVPQQNTLEAESFPTNILDGDTLQFSAGVGFRFQDPIGALELPLHFDIGAHLSTLLPREAYKGPTDSNPSYRYSGIAGGARFALRYNY